ncbi:MAG TPA: DUF421 domain-containing protein [Gammaproteobacteria bacterium]|nr:DUF421 domain-containing protein [Gammaproteobacteria bacterium]
MTPWLELFGTQMPITEIVIRGTVVYWFLLLMFRFVVRRDLGGLGIADVLLIVIVSDAAQNAMAGGYTTISEGLVLLSTIIGWNLLVNWLAFRFPAIERFTSPSRLQLVRHGRILHGNLHRELLTVEDLMSQLRLLGIERVDQVKHAYLERGGNISVIRGDGQA